ncbi:MAG: dUTP diphosphatase [Hyphomicrobiales bacterium]|nr:MAG: dUTP diphosphatase [Hyphomicrobiales bacterium]
MTIDINVQRLPHGQNLELPFYQSDGAAGMDLYAAIDATSVLVLEPGAVSAVPTGFAMALPAGFEAQIRPRSGLAAKHSVTVLNAPGTIDSDYRGEIKVLLINHGKQAFDITRGMRIAQMIIAPVTRAQLNEVDSLDDTQRGAGGFGSTGVA